MREENSPDSDRIAPRGGKFRAGIDQVRNALRLREIELAVEESALREFPGSAARAPSSRQRRRQPLQHAGPPWPCSSSTSSPV